MSTRVPEAGPVSTAPAARVPLLRRHDQASLAVASAASLALHAGVLSAAAWWTPRDSSSPLLVTQAGPTPDSSEATVEVFVVASEDSAAPADANASAPSLTDQADDILTEAAPAPARVEKATDSKLAELQGVAARSMEQLQAALTAWLDRIASETSAIAPDADDAPASSPSTADPAATDEPASNPGQDAPQASAAPGPDLAPSRPPASRPPAASILAPAPIAGNAPPVYPTECRRRREQGTVTLRIHVGADGRAIRVAVDRSSGVPRLDDAARAAAGAWRFAPATENGIAVEADAVLPVHFVLSR